MPTPSKSHYLFNTRDLAKVIQGTMQATRQYYDCTRAPAAVVPRVFPVFGDRMWDKADTDWLKHQLDQKLNNILGSSWEALFERFYGECPLVSFMRQGVDDPVQAVRGSTQAQGRADGEARVLRGGAGVLGDGPGALQRRAAARVSRAPRADAAARERASGGRGRIRAEIARQAGDVHRRPQVLQHRDHEELSPDGVREDLKTLFRQAGVADKPTVFLFDETQIVVETFLEDINNASPRARCPTCSPRTSSRVCARTFGRTPSGQARARCRMSCISSSSRASSRTCTSCCACLPSATGSASGAACSPVWSTAAPSTGSLSGRRTRCRRLQKNRWRRRRPCRTR